MARDIEIHRLLLAGLLSLRETDNKFRSTHWSTVSLDQRVTGWKSIAVSCCTFFLGFLAVAFLVHLGIRDPQYLHADIRSEKLALLHQWSGTVYSASFGSSHVHNGFDPRVFDSSLAGTPLQSRTVNLAIAGGSQTEQRMTALEFLHTLQAPPAPSSQACTVILELAAGANFTTEHLVHPRAINIYDWPTTRFVMRLVSPQMSLTQRLGRIGYAWAAMALHYMNVGMLSSRIFAAPLDQQMMQDETVENRRGILLVPEPSWMLANIQKKIAQVPQHPTVVAATLVPGNRDLVEELNQASPVRNLSVAYIVMPMISDLGRQTSYPDSLESTHGPVPIINLGQPRRYPELYQPKLWLDDTHLNGEGAQLATSLFAQALKQWYAVHGGPAPCERK